jgi:hypothetical protein
MGFVGAWFKAIVSISAGAALVKLPSPETAAAVTAATATAAAAPSGTSPVTMMNKELFDVEKFAENHSKKHSPSPV